MEIDPKHVAFDQLESLLALKTNAQALRKARVTLNGDEPAGAAKDKIGERSESRPDLDHRISPRKVSCLDDA
jgi:hypothetical protein